MCSKRVRIVRSLQLTRPDSLSAFGNSQWITNGFTFRVSYREKGCRYMHRLHACVSAPARVLQILIKFWTYSRTRNVRFSYNTLSLASFPGSPHAQTKICTASDGKLGRAWKRGYIKSIIMLPIAAVEAIMTSNFSWGGDPSAPIWNPDFAPCRLIRQ